MIASLDLATFSNEAYALGQFILRSEEVKHYRKCKLKLESDPKAKALIQDFVRKKEAFAEVERFGKYYPDYQRINKEMREAKRAMDLHDTIIQFKKAEKELESILNEISQVIAFAVSEDIKVPNGNPFWDVIGCGGSSCGSGGCGSCGN